MKRILTLILAAAICFSLSACGKADINLSIEEDRSVKFETVLKIDKDRIDGNIASILETTLGSLNKDWEVKRTEEDSYETYTITGTVKDISEITAAEETETYLIKLLNKNREPGKVKLFYEKDGVYHAKWLLADRTTMMILNSGKAECMVRIKLPDRVKQSSVEQDEDNIITWSPKKAQESLEFSFSFPKQDSLSDSLGTIAIALGAMVVVSGTAYYFTRRRIRAKEDSETADSETSE